MTTNCAYAVAANCELRQLRWEPEQTPCFLKSRPAVAFWIVSPRLRGCGGAWLEVVSAAIGCHSDRRAAFWRSVKSAAHHLESHRVFSGGPAFEGESPAKRPGIVKAAEMVCGICAEQPLPFRAPVMIRNNVPRAHAAGPLQHRGAGLACPNANRTAWSSGRSWAPEWIGRRPKTVFAVHQFDNAGPCECDAAARSNAVPPNRKPFRVSIGAWSTRNGPRCESKRLAVGPGYGSGALSGSEVLARWRPTQRLRGGPSSVGGRPSLAEPRIAVAPAAFGVI